MGRRKTAGGRGKAPGGLGASQAARDCGQGAPPSTSVRLAAGEVNGAPRRATLTPSWWR